MALSKIEEPASGKHFSPAEHPLWRLGFRPFYLLAAAFGAISVPLWIAQYFGWLSGMPHINLFWHMHEMVFGFAIAVIIGFLLTAMRAWTGLWTPRKAHLAALVSLWLAGRAAMLLASPLPAAIIDLLFVPLAAWPMYRVLRESGNNRNLFLIGLLAFLTLTNALFHGAVLGWIALNPLLPIQAAILIIVILESVIGARVIPMFTANGAPDSKPVVHPGRDRITMALTVAASLAWIFGLPPVAIAALAVAAAASQLLRLIGWQPHRTLHQPLLWILHLSYAWIPIGFLLIALAALQLVSASAAFHALTVGSMGGLMIGMITRTALGHTGRPLEAGRWETLMYLLVQAGAVARVCAALDIAGIRNSLLLAATVCWSSAFLLYVFVYGPYLVRPRLDGREG